MGSTATRSTVIKLRADKSRRALIDRAADAVGKNRLEFMLDAATREATTVLLDRRLFELDARTFKRFAAALDGVPRTVRDFANSSRRKLPGSRNDRRKTSNLAPMRSCAAVGPSADGLAPSPRATDPTSPAASTRSAPPSLSAPRAGAPCRR